MAKPIRIVHGLMGTQLGVCWFFYSKGIGIEVNTNN